MSVSFGVVVVETVESEVVVLDVRVWFTHEETPTQSASKLSSLDIFNKLLYNALIKTVPVGMRVLV